MNTFLRLRHWQLFLLFIGLPILFQMVIVSFAVYNNNPASLFFSSITTAIYALVLFGWFWALGTNLYKKLPPTVEMNITRFKAFLLIPIVYIILLFPIMAFFMSDNFVSNSDTPPNGLLFIIPLHLFTLFCIFYCIYFIAKELKTVEWQRPVTFNDYAGEFFLIWFFPIGVWFIQPRINKLFDEQYQANKNLLDSFEHEQ